MLMEKIVEAFTRVSRGSVNVTLCLLEWRQTNNGRVHSHRANRISISAPAAIASMVNESMVPVTMSRLGVHIILLRSACPCSLIDMCADSMQFVQARETFEISFHDHNRRLAVLINGFSMVIDKRQQEETQFNKQYNVVRQRQEKHFTIQIRDKSLYKWSQLPLGDKLNHNHTYATSRVSVDKEAHLKVHNALIDRARYVRPHAERMQYFAISTIFISLAFQYRWQIFPVPAPSD